MISECLLVRGKEDSSSWKFEQLRFFQETEVVLDATTYLFAEEFLEVSIWACQTNNRALLYHYVRSFGVSIIEKQSEFADRVAFMQYFYLPHVLLQFLSRLIELKSISFEVSENQSPDLVYGEVETNVSLQDHEELLIHLIWWLTYNMLDEDEMMKERARY